MRLSLWSETWYSQRTASEYRWASDEQTSQTNRRADGQTSDGWVERQTRRPVDRSNTSITGGNTYKSCQVQTLTDSELTHVSPVETARTCPIPARLSETGFQGRDAQLSDRIYSSARGEGGGLELIRHAKQNSTTGTLANPAAGFRGGGNLARGPNLG